VAEGRGTDLSFRWVGAQWVDGPELAQALNDTAPPGIVAHPHSPEIPGRSGACPGVLLQVSEPRLVRPVALGLRLLALLPTLWPERFSWAPYPTAVNPSGEGHLFRLLGQGVLVDTLARIPESVGNPEIEAWTRAPGWWARAEPHLLYD
jgi:uncharacterized protein YbbC (DUF1343 family)